MKFRDSPLAQIQPRRLRKLLTLFFLAMALPTALLVYKSYDQLKWEAFYQHRQLAEELSNRIDKKIRGFVQRETSRNFDDYRFVIDDETALFKQRSPLSIFPTKEDAAGVVGYFQIDSNGDFSTPLLPSELSDPRVLGFSSQELNQRRAVQSQVQEILTSNKLVEQRDDVSVAQDLAGPSADLYASEISMTGTDSTRMAGSILNQSGFDKLSRSNQSKNADLKMESLGGLRDRLEELELKSPYKERVDQRNQALRQREASVAKEVRDLAIKKSTASPPLDQVNSPPEVNIEAAREVASTGIELFTNEFDTFETGLLASGHFIMYRRVWRSGKRYIQGLVIEQKPFIDAMIGDSYSESLLAQMSTLSLIYQGNLISSLAAPGRAASSRVTDQLSGALLYRTRLSAPFNDLENVFTLRSLPAGPGGRVVLWAAAIMALVLGVGFFLIYRMSLKNLLLVRQQQDFVSAVSHELKTPLTSIRMYGEMLQEGWVDDGKKNGYYRYIFDESERLTRLINNVLQLARMTRNETPVELKRISVSELVDVIQSKINSQVDRASFKLTIRVEESVGQRNLAIDADIFSQVIINLVDNAIKFSSKSERKEIEIDVARQSGSKVSFSIRDFGPGIAKDQIDKIFTLFYRSEDEMTRETSGTGIGLALVSQLTSLMSGEINVANRHPGAEFSLYFTLLD